MKFKFLIIFILLISTLYAQDKRRIGLIPFENTEGDDQHEWVSYGFEYLLLNKLSVLSNFYVPETKIFKQALKEAGYGSRPIDERLIYHIGKSANVEVTLSGRYRIAGNKIGLTVRFSDAFNGSTIMESSYNEPLANMFGISNKIIEELIVLAGNGVTETERRLLDFQITKSMKAFESFVKGYIENEKPNSRLEAVIGLFKQALREDPAFWEAYYNLGITYYNKESYREAQQQFNKVIQGLPNFDKPYYGRGLIYEKQKKYQEAINDFKKVTELNPNDHKAWYYLGKINIRDKKFKEAEKYLTKAREINPEYAPIYYEFGNIYYNQKLYRQSINYFKQATELDVNNANYHRKLGDTYYRSQIFYNAYNELKTAIDLRPNDAIAYFLLGITVYKQAVLEELISAFLDLLANDGSEQGVSEKGFKKKTALDPVKSRQVYEDMADAFMKAAQARPGFMEATFNLALTYHEMGNTTEAEKYYKSVLQINPNLVRAYMKLALLYTEIGRKDDAIDQYRKVFYIEPTIIVQQPTLGEEHQYINVYKIFRSELDEKLANNPNESKTNVLLAKIFQAQGQYGKAANILRKVLAHSPNNNEAKSMLAKIQKYGG